MKNTITLLALLLSINFLATAQCSESIFLKTQAEVDAFSEVYDCDTIFGSLIIGGTSDSLSDIYDLTPLGNLPVVLADLSIEFNPELSTLNGLNIEVIGQNLGLIANESLIDISALSSILSLGASFLIIDNSSLLSVSILQNITEINGFLLIDNNDSLLDLSGFSILQNIGFLYIIDNEILSDLSAFDNLQEANYIAIQNNKSITSINGFNNLQKINSNISISSNESLTEIDGFAILEEINNLTISFNDNLTLLPSFSNLNKIKGNLGIRYNPVLDDCCRLLCWSAITAGTVSIFNNTISCSYYNLDSSSCNEECRFDSCDDDILIRKDSDIFYLTTLLDCQELTGNLKVQEEFDNAITDLSDLSSITSVGGFLSVTNNFSMENLTGLDNITSVEEEVVVNFNSALSNLEGLEGLNSINDDLMIVNNGSLISLLGLQNVISIHGDFEVSNNNKLHKLEGINSLGSIGGDLAIIFNDTLENFKKINSLSSVGENIIINGNVLLENMEGLENISSFNGTLSITNNDSLNSLAGLENINTVQNMTINNNRSLTNLDELSNVREIDGALSVRLNQNLEDISGLDSLEYIADFLSISSNSSLSSCCNIKCLSEITQGFVFVNSNATNCNSLMEIEMTCEDYICVEPTDTTDTSIPILTSDGPISIYPNPNAGQFFIDYRKSSSYKVSIYNNIGQLIYQKDELYDTSKIEITESGMFMILMETQEGQYLKRIFIQ